jgi:hypothetical protein
LEAITSGSSDVSKHGLVAVAGNPSTDFFNEICHEQTLSARLGYVRFAPVTVT